MNHEERPGGARQAPPRGRWLGAIREPLRAAFFRLLQQALATDDGRRVLADSLRGQLVASPRVLLPVLAVRERPYADVGREDVAAVPRKAPVFLTARFRSGSTLLWNLFRQVPGCRAYYEPLNERRWFDPAVRGERVDRTHIGVSDYWREYEGLDRLSAVYRESWIDRHLYMDGTSWDPDLERYIATLIEAAPERAVLQFNRADFRLPWLRVTFPEARIIHLYRHPRDQWCSSLVDLASFPKDAPASDFPRTDRFYLLAWARDLRYHFPFLDAEREPPYRLFYWIWKLSYIFGRAYAHESFCFETLVTERRTELPRLMTAAGIAHYEHAALEAIIEAQPPGKWTRYADADWFEAHEAYCDAVLEQFLRGVDASAGRAPQAVAATPPPPLAGAPSGRP